MEHNDLSMMDVLIETHIGLERQGPGSPEMTRKALGFLGNPNAISRVADLGCGTGGQTMVLAQNIPGRIVGLDQFPGFLTVFNNNAKKQNFQERVTGVAGSMEDLPFQEEELDLIWSEGAIDNIGFEKGLTYWNGFLKKGGYVAVTAPCWLTNNHPAEIETFWTDAGSGLDTIGNSISILQKAGYAFVAAFTLPETCWTDNYFIPRTAAENALRDKYPASKTVAESIENSTYERELYAKYSRYYGYVFYIGQKV